MADACGDVEQCGQFASKYSAVGMVIQEVSQPVVYMVQNIELSQFT